VLAASGIAPVLVSLDQEPNHDRSRSLEQALLGGNAFA
jgi:hypothetical protein